MRLLITYIKGETTFPEFSVTFMLDDITVGHYNSETKRYIPRDNATNEDEINSYIFYAMRHDLQPFFMRRLTFKNYTESMFSWLKYDILTQFFMDHYRLCLFFFDRCSALSGDEPL